MTRFFNATNYSAFALCLSFACVSLVEGQDNVVQIPQRAEVVQGVQASQAVQGAQTRQSAVQGGAVVRGASSPDAEFRSAVENLVNSYRSRGVSNQLLNRVQNAVQNSGGITYSPMVRIRNIDSYGRVFIFFDPFGGPVATLGPGQITNVFRVSDTVYLQAEKVDRFGNSKVTNIQIEQVSGASANFWDGDDYRHFTLQQGSRFPRGLNNRANLTRYRIEK